MGIGPAAGRTEMTDRPWDNLIQCDGTMSNFDFSIDDGVEEQLRSGDYWCPYAAWDFYGYVWFEGGTFKCDVWRNGASSELIEANSLRELMHSVSDEYGYA